MNEIARQYIEVTGVDVMLGGGVAKFNSTAPDKCGTSGNFIVEAEQKGYPVVYTKAGMDSAVANKTRKLLGLFNDSAMTPEYLRTPIEKSIRFSLWSLTTKQAVLLYLQHVFY